jgi:hypothetical protein
MRRLDRLPVPRTAPPRTAFGRWLEDRRDGPHGSGHAARPWYQVLWLTGVDYFSTLGYQPGLALLAAGALAPVATGVVVLVTLLCAVPVYCAVAGRSWAGQGSIAMLERLLSGWASKLVVLALLGFAATDFVLTATLSAADAAKHALENPLLGRFGGSGQVTVTLVLLALLASVFLRGFREAIGVASAIAIPFVGLNLVVIGRGLLELLQRPEVWSRWQASVGQVGDVGSVLLVSALVFPRLALGLSGFETGVSAMPLVRGGGRGPAPAERIRGTRRLLLTAAALMCGLLLASSLVTAALIPPEAYRDGGPAAGRALAWLAHGLLGPAFGTAYDLATIAILWFAGASAMTGLLNLVPRYLPAFGMAPRWAAHPRPVVLALFGIMAAVTLVFRADVEAQAGAYATGVLVLMLSAAIAVAWTSWHDAARTRGRPALRRRAAAGGFALVSLVFLYTLIDNVRERPDGLLISACFVAAILVLGVVSRLRRSTELRVDELAFADEASAVLWPELAGRKVNLVPLRTATREAREARERQLRAHYALDGPIAWLHVSLAENRSEFLAHLDLSIRRDGSDFVVEVGGAVAVANTIAYLSERMDPLRIFLGLTRRNLTAQALDFLLRGEGETGLKVYGILVRYWEWTPEDDVRPLIFLMSE